MGRRALQQRDRSAGMAPASMGSAIPSAWPATNTAGWWNSIPVSPLGPRSSTACWAAFATKPSQLWRGRGSHWWFIPAAIATAAIFTDSSALVWCATQATLPIQSFLKLGDWRRPALKPMAAAAGSPLRPPLQCSPNPPATSSALAGSNQPCCPTATASAAAVKRSPAMPSCRPIASASRSWPISTPAAARTQPRGYASRGRS